MATAGPVTLTPDTGCQPNGGGANRDEASHYHHQWGIEAYAAGQTGSEFAMSFLPVRATLYFELSPRGDR